MKLKVCGMKHKDNIRDVARLQPDYLGFIFYEKSSRFFEGEIPKLPISTKKVGVFVDASIEYVLERANSFGLQVIQLHGNESPDFCKKLINKGLEVVKVFSVKNEFNFDKLKSYELVCDFFLFDTKGRLPGGNGYTFCWDILKDYASSKPYFLSGGIGINEIENIKQFLKSDASKYCYALDVNSKFELDAGLKDIAILKKFKSQL